MLLHKNLWGVSVCSLTSINTTLGCGGSLLEMQSTGFLQISLRFVLSCLQLAEKENIYIISPQFYDKLSNPYNLVMINLLFIN